MSKRAVVFSKAMKLQRDQFLLFRNEEYLAINKPIGLECHAGKALDKRLTALMASMELLKGDSIPVPVNSLGEEVSGVVLMSRNSSAGRLMRGILKTGEQFWSCKFWGLLAGRLPTKHTEGVINYPLLNGEPNALGVTSITNWKLLKYANHVPLKETSLIEFEPQTNVRDQIRIHSLLSLKLNFVHPGMLHLHQMTAFLPDGERVTIVAPPRDEFLEFTKSLGWA